MTSSQGVWTAVVLFFALGWYMNLQLAKLHAKFDHIQELFNGLRDYLYEIDPQFDEERQTLESFLSGSGGMLAGATHNDLMREKKESGRRTLNTGFLEGGFRAPNK